jgi:ribosomal protein S16
LGQISENHKIRSTWLHKSTIFPYCGYGGYKFINFLSLKHRTKYLLIFQRRKSQHQPVIEQIGTYDPMPNQNNEKLVSFNYERVRHWLGSGAHLSDPVAELLGKSILMIVHLSRLQPFFSV